MKFFEDSNSKVTAIIMGGLIVMTAIVSYSHIILKGIQ